MTPKRFALFGGMCYYPGGGWDDFLDSFDTEFEASEAQVAHPRPSYQGDWWWQIVDLHTGEQVSSGTDPHRKNP